MTGRLFWLSIVAGLCAAMSVAHGQSREARRQAPEPEQYVPQTEPTNLDEGKTAAQIFSSSCAVCHERGRGLAKRLRSAGVLRSFLRQHYTIGIEQASMLADYLSSDAMAAREAPAARTAPPERVAAPGRAPLPSAEPSTASRRPERAEKPEEGVGPGTAVAATQPSRSNRAEGPRRAEPAIEVPPVEPAAPDVQKLVEEAVAEAAERAAATPLTERLSVDPSRVREIPL